MKAPTPILWLVLGLLGAPAARAQLEFTGSPAGINAALTKLFGAHTNFSARADMRVFGKDRKEKSFTPMNFAMLDEKVRIEINLAEMRSDTLPTNAAAAMKQIGLDRAITVSRPDTKTSQLIFPGIQAYINTPLAKEELETYKKNPRPRIAPLGNETLDGHACVKSKITFINDSGKANEATVWNAPDLKNFPIQILTKEKDDTVIIRFRQVQLVRPDARQFETPTGYKQYDSVQTLMLGLVAKMPSLLLQQ